MRIYLTGYMGSGKSTVGKLFAQRTGYRFIDLDEEIERKHGKSIADIFRFDGEQTFRRWEAEKLRETMFEKAVIATGGGCFIYNTDWMLQNGTVIYLHLPFDEILMRIPDRSGRPLFDSDRQLFDERLPIYRQAHHTVDASASIEETVDKISSLNL